MSSRDAPVLPARVFLVGDAEILPPGHTVSNHDIHAVDSSRQLGNRNVPVLFGAGTFLHGNFFDFTGGYRVILEVVEFDLRGGLDGFGLVEGENNNGRARRFS